MSALGDTSDWAELDRVPWDDQGSRKAYERYRGSRVFIQDSLEMTESAFYPSTWRNLLNCGTPKTMEKVSLKTLGLVSHMKLN